MIGDGVFASQPSFRSKKTLYDAVSHAQISACRWRVRSRTCQGSYFEATDI